jgi:tetratricopeptide (TPR) repeat protein
MRKSYFKSAPPFIAASLLLLCLPGCAPLQKLTTWIPFLDQPPVVAVSEKGDFKAVPFRVRPSRKNAEAYFRLGSFYQERGNHAKALKAFQKAIDIDPFHAGAYNGMGISFDHLKEFSLAQSCYRKALEILPDSDQVYNNLGYSYLLQNKIELAIESFNKAISLNGDNARYHRNLQLALSQGKTPDQEVYAATDEIPEEKAAREPDITISHAEEEGEAAAAPPFKNEEAKPEPTIHIMPEATLKTPSLPVLKTDFTIKLRPPSPVLTDVMMQIPRPPVQLSLQRRAQQESEPFIEVVAGPDQTKLAENLTSYLISKGFTARQWYGPSNFHKTVVSYKEDNLQDAYKVAMIIPRYQIMQKKNDLFSPAARIQISFGEDSARYFKKKFAQMLLHNQKKETAFNGRVSGDVL